MNDTETNQPQREAMEKIAILEDRIKRLTSEFRNFKRKLEVPKKFKIGDDYNGHRIVDAKWILRDTGDLQEHWDWQYTYSTDDGLESFWHSPDHL